MRQFRDGKDRIWTLEVNVAQIKHVLKRVQFDLRHLFDNDAAEFARLLGDEILLVDVLFALCEEQAQRDGVTDLDFGRAFTGEVLTAAAKAFVEAYADFFDGPAKSRILRIWDLTQRMAKKQKDQGLAAIDSGLDQIELHGLPMKSTEQSIAAPASSA